MFWNVTLHSLSYLTDRDFYFEKRLDGSAQSAHARITELNLRIKDTFRI